MYTTIKRLANIRYMVILFVLLVISYTLINGNLIGLAKLKAITGGVGILDTLPSYSPEKAYEIFEMQGKAGRASYQNLLIYQDIIFPVIYTLFFMSTITYFSSRWLRNEKVLSIMTCIPIVGGVSDLMENTMILVMLFSYPKQLLVIAYVSNIFSVIKNIIVVTSITLIVVNIIGFLGKFIKRKSKL